MYFHESGRPAAALKLPPQWHEESVYALKHTDVVLRYEMRAAMAQHALMRSFHHEHYDEMVARGNEMAVEVHLYRGDATNQDAVQRMPVQTSELASVLVSSEALHGWAEARSRCSCLTKGRSEICKFCQRRLARTCAR